jgi:TonB family protein
MLRPKSVISAVTPKILLGFCVLSLVSAAILGLLTGYEAQNKAAKAGAEVAQLQNEKTELQTRVAQLQNEKTELQTKVEADQTEIASLQKRIEEGAAATKSSETPSVASAPEQQLTPPPPSLEIKPGAASKPEQPTSPPPPLEFKSGIVSKPEQPGSSSSPSEIKPEPVEETTPSPRQPKRQTIAIAAIKAPQVAGSPGGGTVSISSARTVANYTPKPEYPFEARARRITGSGVCVVDVDPGSGNVTEASMTQSTGNPILDDSAVRTFRKWRFKPGTVSKVRIPFEFR